MIRNIAQCPYCNRPIRVKDAPPQLLLSTTPSSQPCRHLALLHVSLDVYEIHDHDFVYLATHSDVWLWERGRGLWHYRSDEDGPLTGLLLDLATGSLEEGEEILSEYQVRGGDADQREAVVPGAGYFSLPSETGHELHAELHGWAIFSNAPAALVREIHQLVSEDPSGVVELTPSENRKMCD